MEGKRIRNQNLGDYMPKVWFQPKRPRFKVRAQVLGLSPTAFGNQTISSAKCFAKTEKHCIDLETHGFASLLRNRFAFIACNRHLGKISAGWMPSGAATNVCIKHYLSLFVNTLHFKLKSKRFGAFTGCPSRAIPAPESSLISSRRNSKHCKCHLKNCFDN